MSTTLDKPVAVELVEGQPALFWWKRFPYIIEGQPMLFYRRRIPWWTGEVDMQRIDDEFWRVSAARDGSQDSPSCMTSATMVALERSCSPGDLRPSPLCAGQPGDSWAVHIGGGGDPA